MMNLKGFLEHMNNGLPVTGGSKIHEFMVYLAHEAMRITAELNGSYHEPEEVRMLVSKLTGNPVDESFGMCWLRSTTDMRLIKETTFTLRRSLLAKMYGSEQTPPFCPALPSATTPSLPPERW